MSKTARSLEFAADSQRAAFGGQYSVVKISRGVPIVDSELYGRKREREREGLLVFLEGWQ